MKARCLSGMRLLMLRNGSPAQGNAQNRFLCELFSKGCNSPHLIEHSYTGSSVADGKVAMQGTAA